MKKLAGQLEADSELRLSKAEREDLAGNETMKAFLEGEITLQEALFCEYYILSGCNPHKAAREAGYSSPRLAAPALVDKPKLARVINARLSQACVSADEILSRWRQIADSSMEDFLSRDPETGSYRIDLSKAEERGSLHLLKKVRQTRDGGIEIELYDKLHVLDQIARHKNLFEEEMKTGAGSAMFDKIVGMTPEERISRLQEIDALDRAAKKEAEQR